MAKMTVDEFVIELSLSDKVTKGLTQLEKAAKAASGRIESNFNKALGKDFTKPLRQSIDQTVKHAQKAGRDIRKALDITPRAINGNRAFRDYTTAARRAAIEAQRALNGVRANPPAGGGRPPRGGGAGRPTVTPQERAFNRFSSSAGFRNLQNMGGGAAVRAREIQSQLSAHLARSGNSQNNVNAILTRAQSQLQAESQRLRATLQNSSRALQNHTHSVDSASSGMSHFVGGLVSAYAALEVFKRSLEAGMNRQSANTSANFVFGKYGQNAPDEAKKFAADMSDQLGLSFNDTLSKLTGFVASAAPSMGVGKSEEFFKTSSTFGRLMGLNDDKMSHAQTAFEQMASKGTISAEELKGQLAEAMPGAEQLFAKAYTGSDDAKGVAKLLNDMKSGLVKSADILPKVNDEMQKQIDANGGLAAISKMTATVLGRQKNAQEGWLVSFESGFDTGFQHLLNSLTELFDNTGEISYGLGEALGFVFDSTADLIDGLGTFFMHVNGWILKLEAWYGMLDEPTKKLVDDGLGVVKFFGDFLVKLAEFRIAMFALNAVLGGGMLAKFIKFLAGGAVAGGEVAAGGALATAGAALPVAAAGGWGANYLWDKYIAKQYEGKETSASGQFVKGSGLDKAVDWFINTFSNTPIGQGNWSGAVSPAGIPQAATYQQPITQDAITSGVAGAIKQGAIKLDLTVNGSKAQTFNLKPWEDGQNHMASFLDIDYSVESPYATN